MRFRKMLVLIAAISLIAFLSCEFFIYYVVLAKCKWPQLPNSKLKNAQPVRVMLLADTHLLGPFRGHWWDKLRREWQMQRSFQTAVQLFTPEVVFFLGDLFDEGQWVDQKGFRDYVDRFEKLFQTSEDIRTIGVVGNHDVGFHYKLHPILVDRFYKAFNHTAINLHSIRDVHFVTINSMAMENDGCHFCKTAQKQLAELQAFLECSRDHTRCNNQNKLKLVTYSQPIVLQHFPTFRESDEYCEESDIPELERYRENWEVLSKESTDHIGRTLNPRLIFSGHSHHYCKIHNRLRVDEYTVSSFSWRNKNNPSFLLAQFTADKHAISLCYLPHEKTVIQLYIGAGSLNGIIILYFLLKLRKRKAE